MLYTQNKETTLRDELFKNPTKEYRGTPFWSWNGKLDSKRLTEQIQIFKKMGFGGFHMHVRTGMESPYLEQDFMDHIEHCLNEAELSDMLAWLYDEDRWPSGTAGGKVTAGKPENARKTLLFTVVPYKECTFPKPALPEPGRGQENLRQENGKLLAVYDIVLNEDGTLKTVFRTSSDAPLSENGTRWYAYMEYASADPWFNNQAYVDTLNPEAIAEFIQITHEAYSKRFGKYFGNLIPAIFTDEPQFAPKQPLDFALEEKDIFLPWTTQLTALYQERYCEDLLDVLPELIWELPDNHLSTVRWRYQNLLTDLFIESYCDQIGLWCKEHNLYLTGHVMGEGSLYDQTQAVGDAMRCYPSFGLPGIDMLCDFHEYTTAKQTQSIVRQNGFEGMLSELYGVTGWDYDFRGYKLQGDWQAALGVTIRVPHLALMTLKGEAKRDYPASINYQSPWWEEFSMVEDHFARLNTALTRGKAVVKVAVLHPIESYWLYWGPCDQTAGLREQMDKQFSHLAEILLFGGIDFDYLCEATLPVQCTGSKYPLQVGEMAYDTILIPPVRTIRSSTLHLLSEFVQNGGKLLFLGNCPDYIDAVPSDAAKELYRSGISVEFQPSAILSALESERFFEVRRDDGHREDGLIHQLRQEANGDTWLFLCNGKNPVCSDVDSGKPLHFIFHGIYTITLYDTINGTICPVPVRYQKDKTILDRIWYIHESMLLLLKKSKLSQNPSISPSISPTAEKEADILLGEVPFILQEPNMLLLDMAEYAMNDDEYYSEEELLRIDNYVRRDLNIPMRRKEVVQPYLYKPEIPKNLLHLRFTIFSELLLPDLKLALECPETTQIQLNGEPVSSLSDGWYVDQDIKTIPLPAFTPGKNTLEITVPMGEHTNLEYFYLLGDFGVRINGTKKTLIPLAKKLGWGDITTQTLPFYTGNLIYRTKIYSEGNFTVRVPQYRGGLIKILVDGKDCGNIAFSPYTLTVHTTPGEHLLEFKLYGTRQNGFAQLHHTQGVYFYQSPNSWRSAGDLWSYEYRFKPAGILKSPEIRGAFFIDESGHYRRKNSGAMHITDQS